LGTIEHLEDDPIGRSPVGPRLREFAVGDEAFISAAGQRLELVGGCGGVPEIIEPTGAAS
jgi:hypothetical protein